MKTTIELPDAILERTKVAAARRRTSMKNLVIQGLEMVLQNEVTPAPLPRRWRGSVKVTTWVSLVLGFGRVGCLPTNSWGMLEAPLGECVLRLPPAQSA